MVCSIGHKVSSIYMTDFKDIFSGISEEKDLPSTF